MLSENDVSAVAKLSRLKLDEEQIDKFGKQLSGVLELFEKVKDIDVANVEETSQITGLKNIVREDAIKCDKELRPCEAEELLKNVPIKEGANIVVPKVIDPTSSFAKASHYAILATRDKTDDKSQKLRGGSNK